MMNVLLPVGQLSPNAYNPNSMTPEEFAELVAEVGHIGRLPKPVVVRPNESGIYSPDGVTTVKRNVGKLVKVVTSKGKTTDVDQGDFYFSFSIGMTNP